jgi:hypothetical protein
MRLKSLLGVAVCAAALTGVGASAALAGEVKGPPTGGTSATNFNTASGDNANSICAFSGLNDYLPGQGQLDKVTQTPADGPPGASGHGLGDFFPIGCRGGSNTERLR